MLSGETCAQPARLGERNDTPSRCGDRGIKQCRNPFVIPHTLCYTVHGWGGLSALALSLPGKELICGLPPRCVVAPVEERKAAGSGPLRLAHSAQ